MRTFTHKMLMWCNGGSRTRMIMWLPFAVAMLSAIASQGQALSGTKTVCASGCNYATLVAAANDIKSKGVNGPLVVNVAAGNYNEQINFGSAITGASVTNTITFKGAGQFATRVYQSSTYPLYLYNAKYLKFEDMAFECTGNNYTMYLYYADYTTIKNCRILNDITGTNTTYNIFNYYGNNMTFEGNTIRGGYYGIYDYGSSAYNYVNNRYIKNRITKQYYYGMMTYYRFKSVYDGNVLDSMRSGSGYPLYIFYDGGAIIRNNIIGPTGIYMNYIYYPNQYGSTVPYEVYNNIFNLNNSSAYYAVYMYGSSGTNIKFHHNTVDMSGQTAGYNVYLYGPSGAYDIRNNSFTRRSGGYTIYVGIATCLNKFEYNNLYSSSGTFAYYNGAMPNFAAFQTALAAGGFGKGNTNVAMPFISTQDLHLDQTKPAPAGKSVGITTDIDGDSRCLIFPTMGADESMMGKTNFTGNFFGPDTVFSGSPTVFFNVAKDGEPKIFRWYINGNKVAGRAGDSIHLSTTALTGTTATISLVTVGCAKTDSVTKTVIITNPTARPVVDFIGSTYQIMKGQVVKFTDLSTNGPNQWQWSISPGTYSVGGVPTPRYKYVYGSDKTPINEVRFDAAGKYTVCLTASNTVGSGSTVCKNAYVEVIETLNMCNQNVTRLDKGFLYDDGGPTGPYTPNNKCGLQIAPCADTIYFVLKDMNTYVYDYLRIYDGTNNKGKPLHARCSNLGYAGGTTYTNPACRPLPGGDTMMATSGSMYIEFDATYTGNLNQPGFEAYWYSLPKTNVTKPVAKFDIPDSVCLYNTVALINKSTGPFLEYMWDLDGDPSTIEDDAMNSEATFFQSGKQTIRLIAQNCAGTDTFVKEVEVYVPTTLTPNFYADNTNPTINDIVKLFNTTRECVDSVVWDITGAGTVKYVAGTDSRSPNPQVTFDTKGCYSVSLRVYNSSALGTNVNFKNCYITVKDAYCTPGAATLVPDVGISRVRFSDLDSKSDVAKTDYSNYINTRSATVEKGSKYNLTVERIATANTMTRNAWIDWNADGDFDDAGEMLGEERNAKTLSWTVNVTIPTTAATGATVLRIATNFGNLSNKVCGQNQYGEFEDYRVYINMDVTAPVIKLVDADTIYVEQGYQYVDMGATAMDNVDGDITSKITSSIAPKYFKGITGTYKQTYSVKDAAGNTGTKLRVIIVVPDRIAPVLTVNSTDTIRLAVGTPFTEPTATAFDSVDFDVTPDITRSYNPSPFDAGKVGTYLLTYSVTDAANNTATKVITIIVYDDVKPVITLNGADTIYHEVGTAFTDPGATVTDNNDTNVTVKAVSNVNPNVVGTYSIVYNATDASGNAADQVTRTVIVRDSQAPVIALIGDSVVTLDVNTTFNDPGVTFSDNNDKNMTVVKGGTFMTAFPNMFAKTIGTYTLTYTVTDLSGNTAMVSRTINVVDRTAPVITLKGFPVVDRVCRWASYADAGYDISDNYYNPSQLTVTIESSRTDSTQREGAWAIRYKAVDPSGNTSYSDYRLISIVDCQNGVEEIAADNGNVSIYPNPNTGMFTIDVQLPKQEYVKISVMNMLGQEIRVVNNSMMYAGKFNVDLTGEKAGMYFINITSQGNTITKKVNVTK